MQHAMPINADSQIPPDLAALVAGFDLGSYLDKGSAELPPTQPRNRRVRSQRSVGASLRGIGPTIRRHIRAAYRHQGGRCRPLNDRLRAQLAEAIFQVENELEHRQPRHPQVRILRTARNRLYDDLGWNEHASRTTHS